VTQPDLDFTTPRTHAGDPASSHHAEARLRKSGALTAQQRVVLEAVTVQAGLTASQIAAKIAGTPAADLFSGDPTEMRNQVRRRLSDLAKMRPHARLRRRYTSGERESRWFSASE